MEMPEPQDIEPQKPEPKSDRILGFSFDPHTAGMSVFQVSCYVLLLLIVIINLPGVGATFSDYKILQSFELVLTVAGLGIIISFLGRDSSAVAVVFGFLVVAALIIPTRDIVRFALLATGSEKRLDDYYDSSSVGANLSGRVPDVAAAIIREVDKDLRINGMQISPNNLENLRKIAQNIIRNDRILTLVEKVKARGVFELLKAISANEAQQFLYRFSENDRLQDDVAFLRYEDLVSLAYDDMSTVQATQLGRLVVQREAQLWVEDEGTVGFGDWPESGSPFPTCDIIPFDNVMSMEIVRLETNQFTERTVAQNEVPLYLQINILPGEIGTYALTFRKDGDNGLDPLLALFSVGNSSNGAEARRNCIEINQNDDMAATESDEDFDSLDSRILSQFSAGTYIVWLGTLTVSGSGTFSIRRTD